MSRRTKKPKREFSKLILYVVGAVTVGVTAFTLIMVWKTENLEPLAWQPSWMSFTLPTS